LEFKMDDITEKELNKVLPFGTLPHERLEWLINYYNDLEAKRLEEWKMILDAKETINELNLPIDTASIVNSSATYANNVLKIVINDYIPRKSIIREKRTISELRYHWLRAVVDPIRKLQMSGINPKYEKAFCMIKCYVPRDIQRDVDNVAYKVILDGLRYARIITDDTLKQMSFMVDGYVDRKAPRTEIIVLEHKQIMTLMESVATE
jgi:hypothetical protein